MGIFFHIVTKYSTMEELTSMIIFGITCALCLYLWYRSSKYLVRIQCRRMDLHHISIRKFAITRELVELDFRLTKSS